MPELSALHDLGTNGTVDKLWIWASSNFMIVSFAILVIFLDYWLTRPLVKAPVVGKTWRWEPKWLTRIRFFHNAWSIITDGYNKVSLVKTRSSSTIVPSLTRGASTKIRPLLSIAQTPTSFYFRASTLMNYVTYRKVNYQRLKHTQE